MVNDRSRVEAGKSAVAIYHVVYGNEGFQQAARVLFELVQRAQQLEPDKNRNLYLDIEGHRNTKGGFDADMLELQKEFLVGFLAPFLSEIHSPLISLKNSKPQNNDIPPAIIIQDAEIEDQ